MASLGPQDCRVGRWSPAAPTQKKTWLVDSSFAYTTCLIWRPASLSNDVRPKARCLTKGEDASGRLQPIDDGADLPTHLPEYCQRPRKVQSSGFFVPYFITAVNEVLAIFAAIANYVDKSFQTCEIVLNDKNNEPDATQTGQLSKLRLRLHDSTKHG